jgi:predicted phage terminase large subunit-like protein
MHIAAPSTDDLLRDACHDSLVTFAETMVPNYKAAEVHQLLAKKLEDCLSGKTKRLCIALPPRQGKSQLASVLLPAWALTRRPELTVLQGSYGSGLAEVFSKGAKGVLTSPAYRSLFPAIVDPNSSRQREWRTVQGGSYFSAGITAGGSVGRGSDLLVCDDLFASRDDADSSVMREKVWNWFTAVGLTRLSPNGVVVIVNSRWHEDDLIGRIQRNCPEFEHLSIPALCENPTTDPLARKEGESIWPERWSVERLTELRQTLGTREWSSHYMCRPTPPGGTVCDASKVRVIDRAQVPELVRRGRGWDLALGVAKVNDWSCGASGGFDKEGNFILTDVNRAKRDWNNQRSVIVALAKLERGHVGIENVSAWQIAVEEVRKALAGVAIVKGIPASVSKEARACGWLSLIEAGKFYIVRAGWNADFLSELASFPVGTHDDQCDAVSVLWETIRKRQQLCVA